MHELVIMRVGEVRRKESGGDSIDSFVSIVALVFTGLPGRVSSAVGILTGAGAKRHSDCAVPAECRLRGGRQFTSAGGCQGGTFMPTQITNGLGYR